MARWLGATPEFRENAEVGRLGEMSEIVEFRRYSRRESREILESSGGTSRNAEFKGNE